jgi:hypothetical protein
MVAATFLTEDLATSLLMYILLPSGCRIEMENTVKVFAHGFCAGFEMYRGDKC